MRSKAPLLKISVHTTNPPHLQVSLLPVSVSYSYCDRDELYHWLPNLCNMLGETTKRCGRKRRKGQIASPL